MTHFSIKVLNADKSVRCEDTAQTFASLVFAEEYQQGDCIVVTPSEPNCYAWLQLDESLGASLVYLTGECVYEIPFGLGKRNLPEKAFSGDRHYLFVKEARPEQLGQYRNLAVNVCDQHNIENIYPHASANVETRGEAVFFACNAIDGICENRGHGIWPYQSWGINRQTDAELVIDFGREVEADRAEMTIRTDFPHDSWWTEATLQFSDGTQIVWPLEKTRFAQPLTFPKKKVSWVKLCSLKKADDPSPFPALTQLAIYGADILEGAE